MSGNAIDRLVELYKAASVAKAGVDVTFDTEKRPSIYVDGVQLSLIGVSGQYNAASGLTVKTVEYVDLDARITSAPFNADRMKFSVASPVIERVLEPA